ncbi:MAG: MBL fold metallo-hydrolase [Cyanobacteria bacterium Co-bin8]|nr:MBL fold metallo-hydrolase [Cyanobacteria bacterium Co-bin8]
MNPPTKPPVNAKLPRPVFDTVFAFSPNRDTLGGTAYLIVEKDTAGAPANLLIDAPAWDESTRDFLAQQGGVRWLLITHRGAIGKARALQAELGCEVVVQEQEAYLLPETPVTPFQREHVFTDRCRALWTPGHSPGSACLYYEAEGGILFTGRHLLPDQQGRPVPLRFSKTFHWPRQLQQVERLRQEFSADTLAFVCPGANTGFLRGERAIANAYEQLRSLDLAACRQAVPLL